LRLQNCLLKNKEGEVLGGRHNLERKNEERIEKIKMKYKERRKEREMSKEDGGPG